MEFLGVGIKTLQSLKPLNWPTNKLSCVFRDDVRKFFLDGLIPICDVIEIEEELVRIRIVHEYCPKVLVDNESAVIGATHGFKYERIKTK